MSTAESRTAPDLPEDLLSQCLFVNGQDGICEASGTGYKCGAKVLRGLIYEDIAQTRDEDPVWDPNGTECEVNLRRWASGQEY